MPLLFDLFVVRFTLIIKSALEIINKKSAIKTSISMAFLVRFSIFSSFSLIHSPAHSFRLTRYIFSLILSFHHALCLLLIAKYIFLQIDDD